MNKLNTPTGPIFETFTENGATVIKLKQERQIICGSTQLPMKHIDEMVSRKDDLDFQLSICRSIMEERSILPFPFERAVILLHRQKRCDEELELCQYVTDYCKNWRPNPHVWDLRESPVLKRIIRRVDMKHYLGAPES